MSDKFVEKYTVGEDLVKSLNKKDATAAVLYDLIGRESTCDYTKQIVDGVKPNAALNTYIKANYGSGNGTTKLPQAHRVYVNHDFTAKNNTELTVGLGAPTIVPFTTQRNLITSRKTLDEMSGSINQSSFYNGGNFVMGYDFTFTVFDGTHPPGSAHPAPTFTNPRLNLDNKDANFLHVDLVIAFFNPGTPTNDTGVVYERRYLHRIIMHPQDIIEQKMMRMAGVFPSPDRASFKLEVNVEINGAAFNYAGSAPKIGFFKQNADSEELDGVEPDTSNYIDFIEIEHIV